MTKEEIYYAALMDIATMFNGSPRSYPENPAAEMLKIADKALDDAEKLQSEPRARLRTGHPCSFEFGLSPQDNFCLNCGWPVSSHGTAVNRKSNL